MNACFFEFLGTLVLILMGCGVCACTSLEKSNGKGGGWWYSFVPVLGPILGSLAAALTYSLIF